MSKIDVALASCQQLPEPDVDAAPLLAALAEAGLNAELWAWDDPALDWSLPRMTVLRSTWNYPKRFAEFDRWLSLVDRSSELQNPLELVRPNLHKGYLLEFQADGIPIAPTELLLRGAEIDLAALMAARGWQRAVVKPAVSANSWRTRDVTASTIQRGQDHLDRILLDSDALVQAYVPSVESYGERSLIVIDGRLTHAIRKSPRFTGDDESVPRVAHPISDAEANFAEKILSRFSVAPLYARVDIAPDAEGVPLLMELELAEPSLYLSCCDAALERLVLAIQRRLEGRS